MSVFVEPITIREEWLQTSANTFTFATLCSIVGLNSKNKDLNKDHVKTVRRKLLLRYHPDKCNTINAASYFRFYKDCLDNLDSKFESFSFFHENQNIPSSSHEPRKTPSQASFYQEQRDKQQRRQQTYDHPSPKYSSEVPDNKAFFNNIPSSSSSSFRPTSNHHHHAAFQSDEEFQSFLKRAREEEFTKNAHAYNYESQEQTGNRFGKESPLPSTKPGNIRNAEDVNHFFSNRQEEKNRNYVKPTAEMAEEYEKMFSAFQGRNTASSGDGNSTSPKFCNENFEEMLRHLAASGNSTNQHSENTGVYNSQPKKVKPVSLLSNSSSSKLDYAQSLFDGNRVNEDDESSVFLSGGVRKTHGSNLREAHDPRKHLVSTNRYSSSNDKRSFQDYENMRKEDIFKYATTKQEQQKYLDDMQKKRDLRNQERLFRLYS